MARSEDDNAGQCSCACGVKRCYWIILVPFCVGPLKMCHDRGYIVTQDELDQTLEQFKDQYGDKPR